MTNEVFQILLYSILFLTSIPVGWLLAWLTKEELVIGRKWFRVIFNTSYFLFLFFLILMLLDTFNINVYLSYKIIGTIELTLAYLIVVIVITLYKGKDKRFLKTHKFN